MSTTENMEKENIPEKMKGLHINEVLTEAKRKLLKYQRKKWSTNGESEKVHKRRRSKSPLDHEEVEELYLGPCCGGQCPNCQLYVTEEFYVKDYSKKLFACRNCKAQFIGVTSYPYNRKTKWIPYSSSLIGPKEHVQGNPLN